MRFDRRDARREPVGDVDVQSAAEGHPQASGGYARRSYGQSAHGIGHTNAAYPILDAPEHGMDERSDLRPTEHESRAKKELVGVQADAGTGDAENGEPRNARILATEVAPEAQAMGNGE